MSCADLLSWPAVTRPLAAGALFLVATPALADDTADAPLTQPVATIEAEAEEEEPPPPPPPSLNDRILPEFSWDLALAPTFGTMSHFGEGETAMPGLGVRGTWGRNFGNHRIGAGLSLSLEGPITILWSNVVEPSFAWDFVTDKGFWVGASIGPSLMINSIIKDTTGYEHDVTAAPHLGVRIGYSDAWNRIGKRFFVGIEPKVRMVYGQPSFLAAIVIGSGGGY